MDFSENISEFYEDQLEISINRLNERNEPIETVTVKVPIPPQMGSKNNQQSYDGLAQICIIVSTSITGFYFLNMILNKNTISALFIYFLDIQIILHYPLLIRSYDIKFAYIARLLSRVFNFRVFNAETEIINYKKLGYTDSIVESVGCLFYFSILLFVFLGLLKTLSWLEYQRSEGIYFVWKVRLNKILKLRGFFFRFY